MVEPRQRIGSIQGREAMSIRRFLMAMSFMPFTWSILLFAWMTVNYVSFIPPMQEEFYPLWVPQTSEVYSRNVVQPGTFKITLKEEEFRATTQDQNVTIAYKESGGNDGVPTAEYWRPRGDSTFFYMKVHFPSKSRWEDWLSIPTDREARFDTKRRGFVYSAPTKDSVYFFWGGMVIVVCSLISALSYGKIPKTS